jgi:hypothetical protein
MTKQEIVAALAARGILLTPSQIRKSTAGKLHARLDKAGGSLPADAPVVAPAVEQTLPKKRRGINAMPKGDYKPFREGTRQSALFALMVRAEGARLDELAAVVPTWKASTIKSAFHYDFASQHGIGVRSTFDEAGTERFHAIVSETPA